MAPAQESKKSEKQPAKESVEEPAAKPWETPAWKAPAWKTTKATRPAAPDVYLLPDATGKLRKVLGFRYEDFFKAWNHDQGATAIAPPRYVLNSWKVTGESLETHAQLRVEFEIVLQASGWVDVPVQLPKFILQQLTIDDQAEGECLVFDKERHGHVVWLTGKVGQKRKLVLNGLARLKLNPGSFGLELHLPRATTSQFLIRVPDTSVRFECSPELSLQSGPPNGEPDGVSTEVRLLGQANPLRLNWTSAEVKATSQAAMVEVEGQTTVRLDRRRAQYEATLQIQNLVENPLEQIQVRLPPYAKLKPGKTLSDYEIQEMGTPSEQDPRQVVEIRRATPSLEPWEIRLTAERPFEPFRDTAQWGVEGFEVLDAIRQSGTVTLEIDDQLQAYFDTHQNIDQIPLQKSTLAAEGGSVLGQFRYPRYPWQLVVHASPRQKRVSLKPEYDLTFSSEEARLEVEYNYQFTGAQIFSLHVNLQGWELTDAPIESGGLINTDGVVETREGRLVLPLIDPATQQLRLSLSLRKDIQLGDNTMFLPEPLGAFVVDGELRVDSTDAIRVTPKIEETTGLSEFIKWNGNPRELNRLGEAESQEQIRLRTFLARPKFVAEVAQRERQVIATEQTYVEIDREFILVRQEIAYQSKHQPVSQLLLSLPEPLWLNDTLSITLKGEALPFGLDTSLGEEPDGEPPGETQGELVGGVAEEEMSRKQVLVSLPRPMQSEIPIEIAYEVPLPGLVAEELAALQLPLASPNDRVRSHEAVIVATPSVLVLMNQRSVPDVWTVLPEESPGANSEKKLRLRTEEKVSFLSLYAQLASVEKNPLATLERAWFQSWITSGQRQDRAVFRFRTAHATVFAQLPLGLENTEIEVLLDGKPWHYERVDDNRLAMVLPTEGETASHSLELRYQSPTALPSWGKLQSELPRLECRLASAPIYWQLILPRGWQVATSPAKLLPDYWLGWKNYRWGRQPTLSQADLEKITGAVSAMAPTPMSSQYVYRAFEMPAEIEIGVLRQVWLWLVGTLVAFALGSLILYTRLARSGLFWLALALALLAGIFSYPEITLLAVQVVLAGGLMTFAMSVLRRVFAKDAGATFSATQLPSQNSAVDATATWQPQPLGGNAASSETTATMRPGGTTP